MVGAEDSATHVNPLEEMLMRTVTWSLLLAAVGFWQIALFVSAL